MMGVAKYLLLALVLVAVVVRADDEKKELKKDDDGNEIVAAVGIDLGTTFSCVGVFKGGSVEIIPNDQGNRITPSWVAFSEDERLVGEAAKNQAALNPKNTLYDVKRIIGRKFNDPSIQRDLKLFPFTVKNKGGNPVIEVEYQGGKKDFSPEEISAMILSKMKEVAEAYLGTQVTHAVITVPAYFNDAQRSATKDAGTIAGLKVLRIINEPTASAIAYGLDKKGEQNILVFDLGGGTFDVSLLTIEDGVFEVVATNGDTHLGGEDFDQRLADYCSKLFQQKTGKDATGNHRAMAKLKREVERAKRTLSYEHTTKVEIENFFDGEDFSETISRAKFEELNIDLFKKTMAPVANVLKDAKIDKADVSEVLLVGGSTRIPKVRNLLQDFFDGKVPNDKINPDEAVAYGAAVQAGILAGFSTEQSIILLDIIPLSLGVANDQGLMEVLIPRNSPIPTKATELFTTVQDNQPAVLFEVYEGERSIANKNHLLGKFQLNGITPAKRGTPEIEVTFSIDVNGILSCNAEDRATGNRESVTITRNENRLSENDIKRMVKEAENFEEEDKAARENGKARGTFESYVYSVRNSLETIVNKLSRKEKRAVQNALQEAIEWLDQNRGVEKEKVDAQKELTQEIINPIFDRVYKGGSAPADDDDETDDSESEEEVPLNAEEEDKDEL